MTAGSASTVEPAIAAQSRLRAGPRCPAAVAQRDQHAPSARCRWTGPRARPCWSSSPARPESTAWSCSCAASRRAASCSTKPRSVCTGPPIEHRLLGQVVAAQRQLDLVEQVLQLDVDRLVDHQPERALLAVLAQVDHACRQRCRRPCRAWRSGTGCVRLKRAGAHAGHFSPDRQCTLRPMATAAMTRWTRRWSGSGAICAPTTTPRCTTRCALRARCGASSSSTATSSTRCRVPTGASSSSATAWSALDAQLRALAHFARHRGRRADRAPRPCRRRRLPSLAARLACRRSTPTTTTTRRRWRATPACAARWPTSASHCTPRRTTWSSSAAKLLTARRQAVQRVHALQERLAEEARPVLPEAPTRWRTMPAPGRAAGDTARSRCRRWTALGFEPTNLHALKLPSGSAGAQELLRRLPAERIDRYHETRDLPGGQGPELPGRAPALRHRVDPPPGARGLAACPGRTRRAAPRSG